MLKILVGSITSQLTNRLFNLQPGFIFSAHAQSGQESGKRVEILAKIQALYPHNAVPLTVAEVAKHASEHDCWIIIDGSVYDVTSFTSIHPGGAKMILDLAGQDSSTGFSDAGHSNEALIMLNELFVGKLGDMIGGINDNDSYRKGYDDDEPIHSKSQRSKSLALKRSLDDPLRATFPIPDSRKRKAYNGKNIFSPQVKDLNDMKSSISSTVQSIIHPKSDRELIDSLRIIRKLSADESTVKAQMLSKALISFSHENDIQILKAFVKILQSFSSNGEILLETCWILSNVASGDANDTKAVVSAGAIPALLALLSLPSFHDKVGFREQAIMALGNIAGDDLEYRNRLLFDEDLLTKISELLKKSSGDLKIERQGIWLVCNLLHGNPPSTLAHCKNIVPMLTKYLKKTGQDMEIVSDSAWSILFLINSIRDSDVVDIVIEDFDPIVFVQQLAYFTAMKKFCPVFEPLLLIIGALCCLGFEIHIQKLVEAKLIKSLEDIIHQFGASNPEIKRLTMWTLSFLVCGIPSHIQQVIESELLFKQTILLPLFGKGPIQLQSSEAFLLSNALWACRNASAFSAPPQILLLSKTCAPALIASVERDLKLVDSERNIRLTNALVSITNILMVMNGLGNPLFQNECLNLKLRVLLLSVEKSNENGEIFERCRRVLALLEPSSVSKEISLSLEKPTSIFLKSNKDRLKVPLSERIQLSHNVFLLRFSLPEKGMALGLPTGKHIKVYGPNRQGVKPGEWNHLPDKEFGKSEIERKYTPTSSDATDLGFFDLVVKVYRAGFISSCPDGGKMGQYFESLQLGDTIEISGPFGLHEYIGNGTFLISKKERKVKDVAMVAAGTGITPMLQILRAILNDENDPTKVSLIVANTTEEDILLYHNLNELALLHPQRFKVWYTLTLPPDAEWKFSVGRVTKELFASKLPKPSDSVIVLTCGPEPFMHASAKYLNELGFVKEQCIAY